jgi:hypothetical protein
MEVHEVEGMCAVHALMLWEFNVSHCDIIKEIYGDNHREGYLREKLESLNKRGLLFLYGQLDGVHRKRFIKAMYKAYGDEAKRSVNCYAQAEINQIIEGDKDDAPY